MSSCRISTKSPVVVRVPPTMMVCSLASSIEAEVSKLTRRISFPDVVLHKLRVGRIESEVDETKGRPPTRRILSVSNGRNVHRFEGDAAATVSTKEDDTVDDDEEESDVDETEAMRVLQRSDSCRDKVNSSLMEQFTPE